METTANSKKNAFLELIIKREAILRRLCAFAVALTGFFVINSNFGYMGALKNDWIAVAVSVMCAFIPLNAIGFILFAVTAIHLFALSLGVSILFVILWLIFIILAKLCGSENRFHLIFMSVLYTIHIPFLSPLYIAYFGKKRDSVSVVGGAVIAFLMRTIKLSEGAFKTNLESFDSFTLFRDNLLANLNFYVFVLSSAVLFFVVILIKNIRIKHAWLIATFLGVITETMLMSYVYMFTGARAQINMLLISNVITLVVGAVISILLGDVKVNGRSELDMEDDDYYYHVICIPKVRIEENQKRLVRITPKKSSVSQDTTEVKLEPLDKKDRNYK